MSLLDDLNAIDVTVVVDAKGLVSLALQSEDIQKLLTDGPAVTVLGDLGTLLAAVEGDFSDPEAYVAPLLGALGQVGGRIEFDNADVAQAVDIVSSAATILSGTLGGLSGDLSELKVDGVKTMAERFGAVGKGSNDFAQAAIGAIARQRHLLDLADRGLPTDPAALAEFGLDILLPFPKDVLGGALREVQALNAGLDGLSLPQTRITGLVQLMTQIRVAADAGDAVALQAALDRLPSLRGSTIDAIGDDIRLMGQQLVGLGLGTGMTAVCDILDDLKTPDISIIDELEEWRQRIRGATTQIGNLDVDVLRDGVDVIFDFAEQELATRFEAAFDAQVDRLENWLRALLAELPIAELRGKITSALEDATRQIEDAGIDNVASELRTQIGNLSELVGSLDLQALVDTAVQALGDALAQALDQIEAALGTITDQINAVADQVQEVLGRAIDGVTAFVDAIEAVTQLVADIDITAAAQAVIDILSSLRETAEELLTAVPLPEALRDEVAKFADEVAALDVEELVRQPLTAAIDQLQIPDEIGATVDDGLSQIADIVANLIPDNIAAELQAELDGLFSELENIDLSGVLGGIGDELSRLASVLEEVDLIAAMAPAQEAFLQARGVLERIKPSILLAPVIRAYDDVIGQVPLPDPQTIAERAGETVSAVGEPLARAATQPARALAGAEDTPPEPANDPVARDNPLPEGVRPGDIIRLVGYLPDKLKQALDAMEEGPAGEVLANIQRMCGGLAADIRRLQRTLAEIDTRIDEGFDTVLAQLAQATTDARVSLQASAAVTAGPVDARASLDLMATLDATRLRNALSEDLAFFDAQVARARRSIAGTATAKTDAVARVLESCAVARFGDDLGAFLDAIDVNPLADEMDAMLGQVLQTMAGIVGDIEDDLARIEVRLRALLERFNPGALAQKFLRVLNVLKEQFDLINPRRLADELDEVHRALLSVFDAYAPETFARDLDQLVADTAVAVRGLDPASLTPDFSPVEAQVARVTTLLPIAALDGVGSQLDALSEQLERIDISALLGSVNTLTPQIVEAVDLTAEGIKTEILALLGAIEYASTNASASGSVSVSGGISL